MEIKNIPSNFSPRFTSYDARKFKGIVMCSNFDGIADEMKRIGDIENFKVFLLHTTPQNKTIIQNNNFPTPPDHSGCWAQDRWGIIKDSLLTNRYTDSTNAILEYFGLRLNQFQQKIRSFFNYETIQEKINLLSNAFPIKLGDSEKMYIEHNHRSILMDKDEFHHEISKQGKNLEKLSYRTHIPGGNYFITRNSDGRENVLIGETELQKFAFPNLSKIFNNMNINILPQADYHLDLFIRPLYDNKVLIADDKLMLDLLQKAREKIIQAVIQAPPGEKMKYRKTYDSIEKFYQMFRESIHKNHYADLDSVARALNSYGYQTIRVPGRFYQTSFEDGLCELKHLMNYINALVHINDKGEVVYITNKSNLDEEIGLTDEIIKLSGFSFEKAFLDAIKPYVDKVYFVSGDNNSIPNELLSEYMGGIHCMTMEVP